MSTGTKHSPQGELAPIAPWKRWQPTPPVMVAWGVLLAAFLFTYRETLLHLLKVWSTTPDYEHGFLVPIFAGFLLWHRQEMVDPWPNRGSWWGLPFLAVFALIRWFNLFLNYERDVDSLIFFLLGMTLVLSGWRGLRWAWPSILFLLFMVPLPDVMASALGRYLQHIATICSVYVLQTVGIPAIPIGNVIQLTQPDDQLNVETACSGLKMLTVFFAICVGVSIVLQAPWWKKLILIFSAVPIAIFCNVLRISLTGVLYEWVNKSVGNFIHDYAGWWMMVPAMLMIWGEMALLSALIVETPMEGPLSFGDSGGVSRRPNPLAGASALGPGRENPRSDFPMGKDRPRL